MPLNAKSISVTIAVIAFFCIAIIGLVNNFTPLTCSKRALTAAIIAYVVSTLTVKAVNAILLSAMIERMRIQQEAVVDDNENDN